MTHPKEVVAVSLMILAGAYFVFLLIYKPKKKFVASVPTENIIAQYDYLLKLIHNAAGGSEVNWLANKIEEYKINYCDHPDVLEYADSLTEELQCQANYLLVVDGL